MTIQFDSSCKYLDSGIDKSKYPSHYVQNLRIYYKKIVPFVDFYQKQIEYYNHTAYEILTIEISLILPTFPKERRQKRGIITLLITGFIILSYKGISSFLHNKRHKVIHKAFVAMENKLDLQQNRVYHLEDAMVMYGIYNLDTLKKSIDTVHNMLNHTTWNEKLVARKIQLWYQRYLSKEGVGHYAINSLLFLTTAREKYVKMYKRFIDQLKMYAQAIRILLKGYLPISLLPPSKLIEILD